MISIHNIQWTTSEHPTNRGQKAVVDGLVLVVNPCADHNVCTGEVRYIGLRWDVLDIETRAVLRSGLAVAMDRAQEFVVRAANALLNGGR